MRIAIAQINSTGDYDSNLYKVRQFSERAAAAGAEVVVFPEATMVAFGNNLETTARDYFDEWTENVRSIASCHQIFITVGGFELAPKHKVKNVLFTAAPNGNFEKYQKIHLYDAFGYLESESVLAGENPVVANISNQRIGFAICYDIRFPELFTANARNGASLSIVSASWGKGQGKLNQWRLLARARALDSSSYIVACDQADPNATGAKAVEGAPTGIGHSLVVDPYGEIVAELGKGEELKLVDLHLEEVASARKASAVLSNSKLGH